MPPKERVEVVRLATGPQKPVNEYKRFAMLVLGSFGSMICSFCYGWNLIAASMQQRYNLSQRDLSTIVTVGLSFQFGVLPYAFLYDFLGPIPIAVLGTLYFPLGTLLFALCFMGHIEGGVLRLSVFNATMTCGCALFDLISCITVLSHFPTNRGPVTALLKTFTGLGSALVAALYAGFFNSDPRFYFVFLFGIGLLIGLLCIAFMRLPPYHLTQYEERTLPADVRERCVATKAQYLRQEAPLRRFVWGFFILVLLIVFLPTQGALVSYLGLGKGPKIAFAIVTCILTLLYLIVALPVRFMNSSRIPLLHTSEITAPSQRGNETQGNVASGINGPDVAQSGEAVQDASAVGDAPDAEVALHQAKSEAAAAAPRECGETEIDYLAPQYQGTFLHNLISLEMWALWWTSFVTSGVSFVVIFNARFLLASLQSSPVDDSLSTLLTVLNGVGSAVGRLLMSYFEVWSQKRKAEDRIPITGAVFFSTSCIIISVVLFLALPAAALPLPYVIVAMGNGFFNGVVLLVTRTIFAKDPAKHYHFCFSSFVVSAILFNRFLYGEWYTVQAEKQARADKLCYGKSCVLMPLLVMLGLGCSALITDVMLNVRYRSYCRKALAERARLQYSDEPFSGKELTAASAAEEDLGTWRAAELEEEGEDHRRRM